MARLLHGQPTKQIAAQCGLGERTVRFHRANIREKFREVPLESLAECLGRGEARVLNQTQGEEKP